MFKLLDYGVYVCVRIRVCVLRGSWSSKVIGYRCYIIYFFVFFYYMLLQYFECIFLKLFVCWCYNFFNFVFFLICRKFYESMFLFIILFLVQYSVWNLVINVCLFNVGELYIKGEVYGLKNNGRLQIKSFCIVVRL